MAGGPKPRLTSIIVSGDSCKVSRICVCIPTCNRPQMIDRLLANLLEQVRQPEEILVVDSSSDNQTAMVVKKWAPRFADQMLRHIVSERGLTLQRNVGIDHTDCDLICMLDDDVVLETDCLKVMEDFMNSPEGKVVGGISAYITNSFGKNFLRYQRLYHRLGIYEKLRPGCWLYCGDFLELSTLKPFHGIYFSEFTAGCGTMWRREIFEHLRPDSSFNFDGEDKHFSLEVGRHYSMGVLGQARLVHDHFPGGVRRKPFFTALWTMRNKAVMLRELDPSPKRYLVYLVYQPLDLMRMTLSCIFPVDRTGLAFAAGYWVGWWWNIFSPPGKAKRLSSEICNPKISGC